MEYFLKFVEFLCKFCPRELEISFRKQNAIFRATTALVLEQLSLCSPVINVKYIKSSASVGPYY